MKKSLTGIALAVTALVPGAVRAADLTIILNRTAQWSAPVWGAVYADEAAFADSRAEGAIARFVLAPPLTSATVHDLPDGRYAVAVFVDVNGNQSLDRTLLGLPAEPFAFSGGARRPDFARASFRLEGQGVVTLDLGGK